MTPTRLAKLVSCLCLFLCFLCLGASVFLIATGGIGRAMIPVSLVLPIFRLNLWFRRRQQARERKTDEPQSKAMMTMRVSLRITPVYLSRAESQGPFGTRGVKVDGRSVQGLSRLQADLLTSGLSGRRLRVLLRRGGGKAVPSRTLSVSSVPSDEFSAGHDALDGLTLKKPNGGPWIILNVLKDSPGAQMNLQAGDEITRMSGSLVAQMVVDQLVNLMRQSRESFTLSVTRPGRAAPLSVKLSTSSP